MSLKTYIDMTLLVLATKAKVKKRTLEIYGDDSMLKTNPCYCYSHSAQDVIRSSTKFDNSRMTCNLITVKNEKSYMGVQATGGLHGLLSITILDRANTPTGEDETGGVYILEPQTMRFVNMYQYNNKILRMSL